MGKRYVFLTLLTVVFLAIGGILYSYFNSYQYLQINMQDGGAVAVYKSTGDDFGYDAKAVPVATLSQSTNLKLKKGPYIVVSQAGSDYASFSKGSNLNNSPQTISVSVNFSQSKLTDLIKTEAPKITPIIHAKYPTLDSFYKIDSIKLYIHGDWAGVKLAPLDPASFDIRRVILHKEKNAWTVVTDPPSIVIGAPVYPNIPKDVISDVNNFL
jgi:hypothetical protein